jgi:hypothetical protein
MEKEITISVETQQVEFASTASCESRGQWFRNLHVTAECRERAVSKISLCCVGISHRQ